MKDMTNKLHPVDEQDCPEWTTARDGRRVKIAGDDRLPGLFAGWVADACNHPNRTVIRWVNAGGTPVYKRYCRDCGPAVSEFIKHEDAQRGGVNLDISKDAIASRSNAYRRERQEAFDRIMLAAAERMQPMRRTEYDDYLRSPEWRSKVALIMRRARSVCEGCLVERADDVHHLTYENLGNEFAFELIALCSPCHTRLHDSKKAKVA
jgi:5-methylcytosine-specific restriction endonuclease McrA